jgi:hypothetical protein
MVSLIQRSVYTVTNDGNNSQIGYTVTNDGNNSQIGYTVTNDGNNSHIWVYSKSKCVVR